MGRRALALGGSGDVTVKFEPAAGAYVARCRIRDGDGVRRQVQAQGKSESGAKKALKAALTARGVRRGVGTIHSHITLNALAEHAFSKLDTKVELKTYGVQSVRRYRQAWRNHIAPAMGEMLLHEIGVEHCEKLLEDTRAISSVANTKLVRATFTKVASYASKGEKSVWPMGSPMSHAERIEAPRGAAPIRTLAPDEIGDLLAKLRADPDAVEREIDYEVLWMICTGDRIGNMLAVDWSYMDLVEGFAHLKGVAIEHNGRMSLEFDSSKGNERYIDLPSQLITAMQTLWLKRDCPASGLVFPGKRANPRGLAHLHRCMRDVFTRAGYPWLKPHGFRRTTATELSRAGLSDHEIAAYLGHDSVETTRKHYLAKRQESQLRRTTIERLARWDQSGGSVTALHARSEGDFDGRVG